MDRLDQRLRMRKLAGMEDKEEEVRFSLKQQQRPGRREEKLATAVAHFDDKPSWSSLVRIKKVCEKSNHAVCTLK